MRAEEVGGRRRLRHRGRLRPRLVLPPPASGPGARFLARERAVESGEPPEPLAHREHRPWPLPREPWVIWQEWSTLLFAHWALPPAAVRPHVPSPLELDTWEGEAWVGLVPFHLDEIRPRFLPAFPRVSRFPEMNLRTYVRYGGKPGIWFFSLDAASRAAVVAARGLFGLPYFHAEMAVERDGEWIRYRSRRADGGGAKFVGRYRPVGSEPRRPESDTLDAWLVERYCLYVVPSTGRPRRVEIHHAPWRLRPAQAELAENRVAVAAGLALPDRAPLLHYAEPQAVLTWLPARA